jgi:hypothetical protein
VAELAGSYLYQELATPQGRVSDACRALRAAPPPGSYCQTFGIYRLAWPRRLLVHLAAHQLGQRLVQHWTAKDSSPVSERVQQGIAKHWAERGLDPESLIERLQTSCEEALGVTTDAAFASVIEWNAERRPEGLTLSVAKGLQALAGLENLLAPRARPPKKPFPHKPATDPDQAATLAQVLDDTTRSIVKSGKKALAEFTLTLIEDPAYRLAGAEEALRHFTALAEQASARHDSLIKELEARAADLRAKVRSQLSGLEGFTGWWKRKASVAANLIDSLRQFARSRYQALVLTHVNTVYRDLRNCVPEYLRDVGFNRSRLGDLSEIFDEMAASARSQVVPGLGRQILPAGCQNLDESVHQFAEGIAHAELIEIDHKAQELIVHQYKSLHQMCLNTAYRFRDLAGAILAIVESFLESKLGKENAAQRYLAEHEDEEEIRDQILTAFDEAVPELIGAHHLAQEEVRILAVQGDEAGTRFRELAKEAVPGFETVTPGTGDEIVFFREQPYLPLADLPQLGPQAREAYEQLLSLAHGTPHSRTDLTEWLPVTAE